MLNRRFHLTRKLPWAASSEVSHGDEHGQAIIELALVLPMVVLLVFGALDVGRMFNAQIVITEAAREGARIAAVECALGTTNCATDVNTRVQSALTGLDLTKSNVILSPGPYTSGGAVTVQVNYTIGFITPLIGALIPGSPFTLTGATTMRLE